MKKRERKIEISIWFSISCLGKLTKKIRKNTPGYDSSIIVCFYADFWAKLGTSLAAQSQLLGRQNCPLISRQDVLLFVAWSLGLLF